MQVKLVLATRNPHKLREFAGLLEGIELVPLPENVDLPHEHGATFAENALTKARAAAEATGDPAIADDSGIEVEALAGGPGIRSARYAGPGATDRENLEKLVRETADARDRRAAYVCALALVWPNGREELFDGSCEGTIAHASRGAAGFGYDPIFIPADVPGERTMAELSASEKDAISHRGRAARKLLTRLTSG